MSHVRPTPIHGATTHGVPTQPPRMRLAALALALAWTIGSTAGCDRSGSSTPVTVVGALSPARPEARVFVVDRGDASLRILDAHDPSTGGVAGPLDLGGRGVGQLALDPSRNHLWVTHPDQDEVIVYDASSFQVVAIVTPGVGTRPTAVLVDSTGGQVFVANRDADSVSVFSADSPFAQSPGSPIPVGTEPTDLALVSDTVVVAHRVAGTLSVFDAATPFAIAAGSPFAIDAGPVDLEVDPQSALVFAACLDNDSVAIFDVANAVVLPSITGLAAPTQLARHAGRDLLFVANRNTADVRVFSSSSTPTEEADSPIALANAAEGVAVNAYLDQVLISVAVDDTLRVLSAEPPFAAADSGAGVAIGGQPGRLLALEPTIVQTLVAPTGGSVSDVVLDDGRLYVAHGAAGLIILETTPRAAFADRLLGQLALPSSADGVLVHDEFAFVGDAGSGVQVVDVADPASPSVIRSVGGIGSAGELWRSGSALFVDTGGGGLQVLDVRVPALTTGIASNNPGGGEGFDIDLEARLAYSVGGTDLRVLDLREPFAPAFVEILPIPVSARDVVALDHRTAVVAAGVAGVRAVRINPTAGSRLGGVLDLGANTTRVFRSGDLVLALDDGQRLHIVATHDPDPMTRLGSLSLPSAARRIRTYGRELYVAAGSAGLLIIRFYP
ncbi:MAG: hypothetical protein AB7O52_09320 [Planctomycetota bacterium]